MSDAEMALSKTEFDPRRASISYDYEPWLLEDHPLRSYPTECIPGLGPIVLEWCSSWRGHWKEILFRAICLILACL